MLFLPSSLHINLCSYQKTPFLPIHLEYAPVVLYHGMCHFCILASSVTRPTIISTLPLVPRDKKTSIVTMAVNILVSRKYVIKPVHNPWHCHILQSLAHKPKTGVSIIVLYVKIKILIIPVHVHFNPVSLTITFFQLLCIYLMQYWAGFPVIYFISGTSGT